MASVRLHGGDDKKWQLSTRRIGEDLLEIACAGRWCLDQDLPAAGLILTGQGDDLRHLSFNTAQLSSWDTGFLVFIRALLKLCAARDITIDLTGLPKGVSHLLAMAEAVPEQKALIQQGRRGR